MRRTKKFAGGGFAPYSLAPLACCLHCSLCTMGDAAAIWKYRMDDGRWVEYSSVLNKKIEAAYQKGERVHINLDLALSLLALLSSSVAHTELTPRRRR